MQPPVGVQDDPAALKEAEISTPSVAKLHTLSGNQPLYSHDRYTLCDVPSSGAMSESHHD